LDAVGHPALMPHPRRSVAAETAIANPPVLGVPDKYLGGPNAVNPTRQQSAMFQD